MEDAKVDSTSSNYGQPIMEIWRRRKEVGI